MNYDRKRKEDRPVLAICYDFDKTLSPDDMQAQGYIQSVGYDVQKFWDESNDLAKANDMDNNLAYMWKMVQESEGRMVFNKEKLAEYGARVKLFDGVEDWFERIRAYGKTRNVIVEHYIISSGLKEMIEGTKMARAGAFEKIYASSFYFNDRGVAKWPAQVINYTSKTQFLFRIEKGGPGHQRSRRECVFFTGGDPCPVPEYGIYRGQRYGYPLHEACQHVRRAFHRRVRPRHAEQEEGI